MIDYEKLKLADEICKKSGHSFSYFFGGKDKLNSFGSDLIPDNCILYDIDSGSIIDDFENIDLLITKLTELTQPKPKYEVDERVWAESEGNLQFFTIKSRSFIKNEYVYFDKFDYSYSEKRLHPSKEALIDAQIAHWQSIRDNESHDKQNNCRHNPYEQSCFYCKPEECQNVKGHCYDYK